ncbi:MAG: TIGR01440 family protein [Defluviitaleaceae bacterium]|nr:TIGR01440 family protein [Defluviitaleaceae bacterium]MCL2836387.1 TIGR01440 family protein [Defluviitaleaceae bacterium]
MSYNLSSEEVSVISAQFTALIGECLERGNASAGQIFILGASSSEIAGERLGTADVSGIAGILIQLARKMCEARGVFLAVQCCEHLNRVLVVERECAERYSLTVVNARPVAKAGGSFGAAAYERFTAPVCAEHIQAHLGMDIGDTLIGMHLRPVAVPLRLAQDKIGRAHVVCAYTRPKYIGGPRAEY